MADARVVDNLLFISHNAADRPYAKALECAIHELVDSESLIQVRYSTSDEAGPQGGEKWREWIYRQVVEARTALIVVTPHSLGKPWLLWEAGACWGAALAQSGVGRTTSDGRVTDLDQRLIVSIAYGLTENECPDPLRGNQIILGTYPERIKYLLQRILQTHCVPQQLLFRAGEHMQAVLDRYLAAVHKALLQTPSPVNEASVQDWLSRLDNLVKGERLSELDGFQRWMTLAFGRDGEAAGVPIDVRLHRRLGEMYLARKDFDRACDQFDLARRAAPRDIYVLRPLVEANMKRLLADRIAAQETTAREKIQEYLMAIEDLDSQAFVTAPEAAALYGKYLRRVLGRPEQAAEVYTKALQNNPSSYYLADLLAQTQLELGLNDEAKATYRQALEIIDRIGENNVWIHGTAAAAHLALGDAEGALKCIGAIAALGSQLKQSEIDAVRGGLREVAERSGIAQAEVDKLLSSVCSSNAIS